MLEYLRLTDFQSHKETYIEFCPGINVITGDNHSGKTSVLRALITLAFNQRGFLKHYRRWKKHWPIIEAGWNGHVIQRNRHGYIVDGTELSAVKDRVPRDVSEILQLDRVNFKLIRDDLFLIGEAPGARARKLNKATGLDAQEILTRVCTDQVRGLTEQIKIKEHLRFKLIREISVLSPIEDLAERFAKQDGRLRRIQELEEAHEEIGDLVFAIEEAREKLKAQETVKLLREHCENLSTLHQSTLDKEKTISGLSSSIGRLTEIKPILAKGSIMAEIREKIDSLTEKNRAIVERGRAVMGLQRLVNTLMDVSLRLNRVVNSIPEAKEERDQVLRIVGECPLCNSKLGKKE